MSLLLWIDGLEGKKATREFTLEAMLMHCIRAGCWKRRGSSRVKEGLWQRVCRYSIKHDDTNGCSNPKKWNSKWCIGKGFSLFAENRITPCWLGKFQCRGLAKSTGDLKVSVEPTPKSTPDPITPVVQKSTPEPITLVGQNLEPIPKLMVNVRIEK